MSKIVPALLRLAFKYAILFVLCVTLLSCSTRYLSRPVGVPNDALNTAPNQVGNWIACGRWKIGSVTTCKTYFVNGGLYAQGIYLIDTKPSQLGNCHSLGEGDGPKSYCRVFFQESWDGPVFHPAPNTRSLIRLSDFRVWKSPFTSRQIPVWTGIHPACHPLFRKYNYQQIQLKSGALVAQEGYAGLINDFVKYFDFEKPIDPGSIKKISENHSFVSVDFSVSSVKYRAKFYGGCSVSISIQEPL